MVVVRIELLTFRVIVPEVPSDAALDVLPEPAIRVQFCKEYADHFNISDNILTQALALSERPTWTIRCLITPQSWPQ